MTRTQITQTEQDEQVVIAQQQVSEEHARLVTEIANRYLRRFLWIEQLVWFFVGVVELFLGLELVLRFVGAGPQSSFVQFMTNATRPLEAPFIGLTGNPVAAGRVLDIAALSGMIIYLIAAALLDRILWFLLVRVPRQ